VRLLMPEDIDSDRMLIHVRQAKGRQGRYVIFGERVLALPYSCCVARPQTGFVACRVAECGPMKASGASLPRFACLTWHGVPPLSWTLSVATCTLMQAGEVNHDKS